MLRTLQSYISRELLKTFALTSVGLTLTFSLTGGVFNMMRAEVLTPVQILRLLVFVLPLALTLTLPVAALFSCAMVYGRLAADNEFDACRASGINIHRLLAPAFGLSVFTAVFTFVFSNYFLPRSIRQMEELLQRDLQKLVVTALNMQGYFKHGPFVVHAGQSPIEEAGLDGGARVNIAHAAFMRIEGEKLLAVGTTDHVDVNFWADPRTGDPIAEAVMYDIRAFDFEQNRLYVATEQPFDPIAVPMFTEEKTKWLNLSELLKFHKDPIGFPPVQRQLVKLRAQTRDAFFYAHAVEQINQTGVLKLDDLDGRPRYEIRANRAIHDPLDFLPQLYGVTIKEFMEGHEREYFADRCGLRVARGIGEAPLIVQIRVSGKVTFTDTLHPDQEPKPSPDKNLDAVPLPDYIFERATPEQLSNLDLLGITEEDIRKAGEGRLPKTPPPARFNLGQRVENARIATLGTLAEQALEIVGVIHSRVAFSAATLVMLVLAAALAIIFRGGQLLTAFVISFIPGMLVVVLNITGRQMSENPDTHLVGLAIIWSGLILLTLADAVVLSRFLRR